MANVEVVNNDDDLITYINSFMPTMEEENILKRSYDTLFNQQDDSMSKVKKHKVDFKV